MQYKALQYLYKELREKRKGLGRAEQRPGHTDEEIRNIHRKIDILEHVIGVVLAAEERELAKLEIRKDALAGVTETDIACVLAYAECGMRAKVAAEKLHYHPSTIAYHLRQVTARTGLDPRKFYELVRIVGMIKGEDGHA